MGPNTTTELFVSHLEKEGNFLKIWGQRDKEAVENVERMLLNLSEEFDQGKYMADPQHLHPDMLCCCRFDDGRYYRCKVLDVHLPSGMVYCHYLDYGNRNRVPFTNLRVAENYRMSLFRSPAQATSYILTGVVGSWSFQYLNKISEDILYGEHKCLVVKSAGQHSEIQLMKLFRDGVDYAEQLVQEKIAFPIPQDAFEVMIWTELAYPKSVPVTLPYQFPVMPLTVNQQWAPMCVAQPVPTISTYTVANGLRSSIPLPITSLPGEVISGPRPVKKSNPVQKPPATSFATIRLQDNSEHKVFVSHVDNGSLTFYAQLAENKDELNEMVAQLNDPSKQYTNLKQPFIPGTMCLAKYSEDDAIYRSIITSIDEDTCKVYFVDYGNCDIVKCVDMYEIPPEFTYPKAMAVPFGLSGLNKINASVEMLEAFYNLALEEDCVLKVVPPKCEQLTTKQLAELFIDETNVKELINVEILQKKPKSKVVGFRNAPFPEAGSKVKVKVAYVKSIDRFFVQHAANSDDLQAVMDIVEQHCKGPARLLKESDIVPGAACCALFDEDWYRAMILEDHPELKVLYVDYGNEEVTQADQLRSASDVIVNKLVAQAIPCRLAEVQVNESLTAKFEDLVLEKLFTMHVVEVDQQGLCVVVKLFNEYGVDISDLLNPSEVIKAVSSNLNGSSQHSQNRGQSVNRPMPDFNREYSENRVNGQSDNYTTRDRQEKSTHPAINTKVNSRTNQSHDASENYRTDPEAWGIGKGSRGGSMNGHCDRVDNLYREDSRSSSRISNSSYSNSRNRTEPEQSNCHDVSDSWDSPLSIPKWTVQLGSKTQVSVVFSTNPCDFYIHESGADSDNLQDLIEDHFPAGGKKLPDSLRTEGSVCVAKFLEDGCYYRAEIIKPTGAQTEVRFIDFGNVDMVDNNDLFVLEQNMTTQKAKAIHCRLIGVTQPEKWTEEDIKNFITVTESDQLEAEFIEVDDNLYSVILRETPISQSTINECFGATSETMMTKTTIVKSVKEQSPLALGCEHAVEVSWFETPGRFFVQKPSAEFTNMMKKIQMTYQNKQPLLNPVVGQAVVALFKGDGLLYRGEIKIEKGGKFGVHYMDYGNKALVDPSNIYGLENQFSSLPAQAILCELGNVLPVNGQWAKDPELSKLFQGQFTCSVLKTGESSTVVQLSRKGQDLSSQLVSMGMAAEPYVPSATSEPPVVAVTRDIPTVQAVSETTVPSEVVEVPGVNPQMMIGQFIQAIVLSIDDHSIFVTFEPSALMAIKDDVAKCVAQGLAKLPPRLVMPGTLCLVMDNCSEYKRAVIVDIKSTSGVAVKFLDSGCSEEIPSQNMFLLPDGLACIPALGHECCVMNVDTVNDLQPFIDQCVTLYVKSYDQGRFTGEVLDDCGQPFPFAPVHEVQVPSTILPMAILKQRIAVDIIYASDNSVWLHKAQDPTVAKLLDDMYETCEEGGDNLASVTCGTLCAAKSEDGNWYRAIVESHSCDHAKVQFLDYGNSEDVPLKNLKVLNSFFNIPALAIKADLPIITEDGSNMGTTIMEMAEDKSFVAYFSRKGSQWLVELLDGKEVFSLKLIRTGRALSMENNPFPALMRKPQVSLQVGQTFTAELSFAESLSEFYVHLSSRSEELQKMESDLKSMPHCMKNVEDWPSVGSWVMAQYADDGLWYRGEVLPDKSIYFIDYGNVDKVDLQCLKVLPPALEDVDKLAVKCSLNPPNSKKWLAGAFDQFLQHVEAGAFSIKVKSHDNGCYSVDVIDSTRASVTDKLAESGFVEECQHESAEEQNDSPNEVFFNDKQGAEIVFSNSPSDFYVHLNRDAEMIQNIGEELEKANDFHTCEDFTEGKICAALFSEDDLWYRAQILSGQPGEINVRFIDYGNSSVVTQIKELPQHLLQIPPLAVHCTMPEPSKRTWSTSSCQLFTNLVESESNFHIELLSKEKPAKVNLWLDDVNVNQKLISDLKDVFDGCQDTKTCTIREEQHLDSKLEPQVAESKLLSIGESCKTLEIPLQDQNLADSDISDSTVSEEQHLDSYLEPHQADSSQLPETVESNDEIIAVCQPDHAVAAPDLIDNAVHEEQYADSYLERHRADLSPIPETEESKDQTIEICQSSHTSAAPDIIESCSAVPEEQCSDSHPEPHVADSSQILGIVESIEILQPDHTLPASDIIDSSVFEEQQSHSIEPHQAESNSIPDTDKGTGKILLSDETAGPNINFLYDGPMDTSNLGKTEDSLLNPLDDSSGTVSVGLEDDSVIDVTPEDNICVITLNDTVEEEGILNEITGETVSGKNDSIIEIDTVEKEGRLNEITGETALGRNDSITEITLSEENVIDLTDESDEVTPPKGHTDLTSNEVLKGKNALTTSEESCFTCADSFKPSNIETDCKGHLTDQNLPSAIHAPKIVLPDSSTVDAEYPLVTGDFGNIEPDISEPECYSECPEKFVESTSYKNHSEKASEEDNCVGSSSNQEHSGKCIVVEDNRVHGKVNEIPESSSSQNIEELCDLECVEDAGKTVVTSKVVNQSTQDDGSEVVVTLTTYPDWKSCEFDINGTFHGQSLARAKDFESDFVRAIPGTKTFSFEECEHHHCSVEISTSTDNFAKTSSRD